MSVSVEAAVDGNQRRFEGGERSRHFIDCDLFGTLLLNARANSRRYSASAVSTCCTCSGVLAISFVANSGSVACSCSDEARPSQKSRPRNPTFQSDWRVAAQLCAGAARRPDARGPCSHSCPPSIAISEVGMVAMCAGNATISGKSRIEKQQPTEVDLLRGKAALHRRKSYAQSALPGSRRVHLVQAHQMTAAVSASSKLGGQWSARTNGVALTSLAQGSTKAISERSRIPLLFARRMLPWRLQRCSVRNDVTHGLLVLHAICDATHRRAALVTVLRRACRKRKKKIGAPDTSRTCPPVEEPPVPRCLRHARRGMRRKTA